MTLAIYSGNGCPTQLADGTSGQVLTQGTSGPQWSGASGIALGDAGNYFTTDNVEAALQELASDLSASGLRTTIQVISAKGGGNFIFPAGGARLEIPVTVTSFMLGGFTQSGNGFKVPYNGIYHISGNVSAASAHAWENHSDFLEINIFVNGTVTAVIGRQNVAANYNSEGGYGVIASGSTDLQLNAGDVVSIGTFFNQAAMQVAVPDFSIHYVY